MRGHYERRQTVALKCGAALADPVGFRIPSVSLYLEDFSTPMRLKKQTEQQALPMNNHTKAVGEKS